jgi:hypothetical protein
MSEKMREKPLPVVGRFSSGGPPLTDIDPIAGTIRGGTDARRMT